jgi:AcrR family transcriptional regulator
MARPMSTVPAHSETRDRILAEAERLFRVYGYSKTTVADIADACAMSSSNVYRFFPSKSAINEAICNRFISEADAALLSIAQLDIPASERLGILIAGLDRFMNERLMSDRKVLELVTVAMEEQWETVKAHVNRVTSIIAGIIEAGIAAGEFRAQDPVRAAHCVHSAIVMFCHPVIAEDCCAKENPATVEEMTAFVLAALKAQ